MWQHRTGTEHSIQSVNRSLEIHLFEVPSMDGAVFYSVIDSTQPKDTSVENLYKSFSLLYGLLYSVVLRAIFRGFPFREKSKNLI